MTLRALAMRLGAFLTGRRSRDADVHDELRFHAEMMEEELRRQGMGPAAARREARLRLGGHVQIVEAYGDQRTLPRVETLFQDLRYAVRTLLRTPGFTVAALVTLALGIGANAAIFSVVHTVLLRPLPFTDPARLVSVGEAGSDGLPSNIGFLTFADFRDRSRAFDQLAAIRSWQTTLVTTEAERLNGLRVSWNFFEMLGARPVLGRGFTRHEDHPDRWRVLILSDGLWRRRFNADPGVIGRRIRMNDQTYEIVGVMPASFEPLLSSYFYKRAELWAPLGYEGSLPYACRSCQHLKAIGRLAAGVTPQQAAADLDRVRGELTRAFPHEYPAASMTAMPLPQLFAGPVRGGLYILLAAVGFVLLIACANVANLLLARAVNRTREMAVRAALGAGRARLIRQMLTESALLSVAGGGLGVLLAMLVLPTLASLAPVNVPRIDRLAIDRVVLAFAAGLSLLTGILFGLVPAFRATAADLRRGLTSGARGSVGEGSHTARQLLVIADLALALVLLTGAGLLLKSLTRLLQVDPGFNTERVVTLQFSLVGQAYREDAAVLAFTDRLIERVRALPGIEAVAAAGQIPRGGNGDTWGFHVDGLMQPNPADDPSAERYSVTPGYFEAMQVRLVRGRLFTDADSITSAPVMLVSESAARALFGGRDPIGQRVRIGDATSGPWRTVVGIVRDVHHSDLTVAASPQMYLPQSQVTDSYLVLVVKSSPGSFRLEPGSFRLKAGSFRLKAEATGMEEAGRPNRSSWLPPSGGSSLSPSGGSDSFASVSAIRSVLRELDPTVPIYDVASLDELLARSFGQRRFVMTLLGGFAALALLLAAIGLYGVVSYTVAQRTREVGVRMALGATSFDIFRLILGAGAKTVAAGLVCGLLCAVALTRFLQTLLFDVSALDSSAIAAAVLTLAGVSCLAHWNPLRRAMRVDPAIALRQD